MRSAWVVLILLGLFVGVANAKTPDGFTPSVETVCDDAGLTGAAKGLCNAYCEAMDCDSDNTKASDRACEQVSKAFSKKTGGLDMPCEESIEECPCYSGDDLLSFVSVGAAFECQIEENVATWNLTNSGIIAEFGVVAFEGCWQYIQDETDVVITGITEAETAACRDIIIQYCQQQL